MNDSAPRHEPGPVDEPPAPDPADASEPASADVEPGRPRARRRRAWNTADPALEEPQQELPAPAADLPADRRAGACRSGSTSGKIAGQGEDSDPILRDGRELGLVAVFDGMGGAGGTVYETPDGPRTGAYLASRVARDVVEQRMVALLDPDWNLDGPAAAADLQRSVRAALQERLVELKAPASGLRSRLLRALPTTMATVALQRREPDGDRWSCHAVLGG